jgi:ABC-type multidrug transport system ATPase subunit
LNVVSHIAFDNLSIDITTGKVIAIVGYNGSGKSTLLKIIGGLGAIDAGQRLILSTGNQPSIGYVPERFPKLSFNAVEYLRSMGTMQVIPRVELTLSLAGMGIANRLPDSLSKVTWLIPPLYRIMDMLNSDVTIKLQDAVSM